jgi:hypothetical protein
MVYVPELWRYPEAGSTGILTLANVPAFFVVPRVNVQRLREFWKCSRQEIV